MYKLMDDEEKARFASYLTNHWQIIPNPDVEWIPISETAIYPKLDNDTEVILHPGDQPRWVSEG